MPDMMLELVLLEIYKLTQFSVQIHKISCFAYSHVLTDGSMLHHSTKYCLHVVFQFYLVTYQITKSDSHFLLATLMFQIWILQGAF